MQDLDLFVESYIYNTWFFLVLVLLYPNKTPIFVSLSLVILEDVSQDTSTPYKILDKILGRIESCTILDKIL